MKRYLNMVVAVAFLAMSAGVGTSAAAEELKPSEVSISMSHPRILFTAGQEKELREKMEGDRFLETVHAQIIKNSESYLSSPAFVKKIEGRRMLEVSRRALQHLYYLSYSYRMTGDTRYSDKARSIMMDVCAFDDWNPSHFLDVAEMTAAVSVTYDWLYDILSEEERQTAYQAILQKGIKASMPEYNPDGSQLSFLTRFSNWNAVCNMGMSWGAIAIYDKEPEIASMIIARAINSTRKWTIQEYQPDGNYPEGYTYWSYGTNFLMMLYDAVEISTGLELGLTGNQGILNSGRYILNLTTRNFKCFPYADCGTGNIRLQIPLFWISRHSNDKSILYREAQRFEKAEKDGKVAPLLGQRFLPTLMFWAERGALENAPMPKEKLYVGQGFTPVAVMRNHWGGDDEMFLGLKAGKCGDFHAHMDIGSFVFQTGNTQWFTDLEHQPYNEIEKHGILLSRKTVDSDRWRVFRDGMYSHSQIIMDDRRQNPEITAHIDRYGEKDDIVFAATDLTAVQNNLTRSYVRGVAIVDGAYAVIQDEIKGGRKPVSLRWAAMTKAKVTVLDGRTALLEQDGKRLYMTLDSTEDVSFTTFPTDPIEVFDCPNPGTTLIGFNATAKARKTSTFKVYLLPEQEYGLQKNTDPIRKW